MAAFPRLFSPLRVGPMTVPNRIVIAGHGTNYAEQNLPGERDVEYYRARARGGVGLLTFGSVAVDPAGMVYPTQVCGHSDAVVPRYARLAAGVHEFGGKVIVQLVHAGGASIDAPAAPSSVPSHPGAPTPREMRIDDLQRAVAAFASAAAFAAAGDCDGVEIHAAHGFLLHQFLSPVTNRRRDEYGGDDTGRLRLLGEVVRAIRSSVPPTFAVGMKISGEDKLPGGLTIQDMCRLAPRLEQFGLDFLTVSVAQSGSILWPNVPSMYAPKGLIVPLAAAIKRTVTIPVACVMRINEPQQAEQILAADDADLIGMVRANLADPEFATKAREGRLDEIRYCMACNEGCSEHGAHNMAITCVLNPSAGREGDWSYFDRAPYPKRVVVVGGGPAGLEVARVAASRGHSVTLYEREPQLGGQMRLASRAPGRAEVGRSIDYWQRQLELLGVEVKLEHEVTVADLDGAEAIVLATGSLPADADFLLDGSVPCLNVRQVLGGAQLPPGRVVVVASDAHQWSCSTADYLAASGRDVTLVTQHATAGMELEAHTFAMMHKRLIEQRVQIVPFSEPIAVADGHVRLRHVLTDTETRIGPFDSVVLSLGSVPYRPFEGLAGAVQYAGDCVASGRWESVIRQGHVTGRAI